MSVSNLNKLAMLNLGGFEKRTHFGKLGKKLKIITNFFEIQNLPSITIYQYVSRPLCVISFVSVSSSQFANLVLDLMSISPLMFLQFSIGTFPIPSPSISVFYSVYLTTVSVLDAILSSIGFFILHCFKFLQFSVISLI
jgi:hypothetical protein